MENKEKRDINAEIYKQSRDNELLEIVGELAISIIASCIFGYVGYNFGVEHEEYGIARGIVFGALLPFVMYRMYVTIRDNYTPGLISHIIIFMISIFLYVLACKYIPVFVGIIALVIMMIVLPFIRIQDVNNVYKKRMGAPITKDEKDEVIPIPINHSTLKHHNHSKVNNEYEEATNYDYYDDEYYCERCGQAISEEEFDDYAGLCEECESDLQVLGGDEADEFDIERY